MEELLSQLANGVIDGPDDLMGIGECLNILDEVEKRMQPAGSLAGVFGKVRQLFKRLILEESPNRETDWRHIQELLGRLQDGGNGISEEALSATEEKEPSPTAAEEDDDDDFFASASPVSADEETGSSVSAGGVSGGYYQDSGSANAEIQDPELLKDFIEESKEHLSAIELNMLALEADPGDSEAINAVFRPFHSIKGVAGFLNLTEIHHLSHEVENLLDSARSGKLAVTDSVIDIVLTASDILKVLLEELEQGQVKSGPSAIVVSFLEKVSNFSGEDPNAGGAPVRKVGEILVDHGVLDEGTADEFAEKSKSIGKKYGEALIEEGAASTREVSKALREQRHSMESAASVRVDTRKLDNLVDMVGELVIAQSMVLQNPEIVAIKDQKLQKDSVQLNRITAELQRISMSMRMVPIKSTFQKMIRLVRDLAKKSGKDVTLEMEGEETEIDRNMVEEIYEPMVHMIRNSIDHGIEMPDVRESKGKDRTGIVRISAEQKGGNIVIDIQDDGKGLDPEKIRVKAIERGIINPSDQLDERAIFELIFHPGFSTRDQVTEVSGRGVGMDVVRKCVERLRGKIETSSHVGNGSHFQMKLPLTMAIIDGMIIQIGTERFIVPTVALKESLRPAQDSYFTIQGKGEVVKVRDSLMPLVRLHDFFQEEPRFRNPWEGLLLVVSEGSKSYCLLADEIVGRQEVVIKSLGGLFRQLPGISGGAILGDGKVALIIDVKGIISLYEESANDSNGKRRLD